MPHILKLQNWEKVGRVVPSFDKSFWKNPFTSKESNLIYQVSPSFEKKKKEILPMDLFFLHNLHHFPAYGLEAAEQEQSPRVANI